jgi:putative heme-binding domain-containing protein
MRTQALAALLSRNTRIPAILNTVEQGGLSAAEFTSTQRNLLRTHRDAAIRERAERLFGPLPVTRPEVVRRYTPALRLVGIPERGQAIFQARCASCHWALNNGERIAPNLASIRSEGKEKILKAIVEPNADVVAAYAPWTAETKAGENLVGIKEDENLAAVTVRQLDGTRAVWPRLNLQGMETETWSFMPTGLDEGLGPQDMADLLEYIVVGPR